MCENKPFKIPAAIMGLMGIIKLSLSLIFPILGKTMVLIVHGVWGFLYMSFIVVWLGKDYVWYGCQPKQLKIHRSLLTTVGVIVSVIIILQYFASLEWILPAEWRAKDIALLCYIIVDIMVNFGLGCYMCCCQTDIDDNDS